MNTRLRNISALCGLLCTTSLVHSATEPSEDLFDLSLEELMGMEVEIATGTKKALSKAPAVVTLITADDLKKTGYTNAIEALEMVPGIHVRFNRMGYSPFIQIRGTNTNQTLLMVNGQSMRSHAASWPQDQFWKGLPVSAVDRIEIVRGPGSVLYEANAAAGVVNIITKTAGVIEESEAGVRVGTFDSQETWVQHGEKWHGFDVGFTFDTSTTGGHDPSYNNDLTNGDTRTLDLSWKNVDLRGYVSDGIWRAQADYTRQYDVKIGLNGQGLFDSTATGDTERMNLSWLLNDKNYTPNWGLDAEVRYQHLKFDSGDGYTTSTAGSLNQEGATEQQFKTEISGLYSGYLGHSVRLGGGVNYEKLSDIMAVEGGVAASSPFAVADSRTIHSLFLQDVWQLNEVLELTVGNRWDHYNDFGNTSNARAALVWQTSDELVSKLMYGEGFRVPTFREINDSSSIEAEKTKTYELAFNWKASEALTIGSNLFLFHIEDLISGGSNKSDFYTRGIELESTYQLREDLRLAGNFTIRNPDNNETRKVYEPYKDAYLRMDWRYKPDWNINVQANWLSDRRRDYDGDTSLDSRSAMDDNFIIDTTVRYNGLKEWELAASVRNLFDEDAMEYTGGNSRDYLPLAERNLFLEARYKF